MGLACSSLARALGFARDFSDQGLVELAKSYSHSVVFAADGWSLGEAESFAHLLLVVIPRHAFLT